MYDELVLFVKIVKLGSFAEAAKYTGISSSNLTRKIQKLESIFNFTILKRDTRTLELSNAGKQLYEKFCGLEHELEHTLANIQKGKNALGGQLHILLPPFFALKIITPFLADFLLKYPHTSLNITYQNRETNLIRDNFDLAIINHRPLKNTQKMKLLCRSKIIFYCSLDYVERYGLITTKEELEEKLIMGVTLNYGVTNKPTYLINKISKEKCVFKHKTYRIIQHSGLHDQEIAMTGPIIGAGLDILLQSDFDSGNLIHILPDYYIDGFEYYLLINPEGKNARTQAFIDFIHECIQRISDNNIGPNDDLKSQS